MSLCAPHPANATGSLAGWAVVIAAGDDHAGHQELLTEAFDNARRDVGASLERDGFSPTNIAEFSVQPWRYADAIVSQTAIQPLTATLRSLSLKATDGCLLYFTSHGSPDGMVFGGAILSPTRLAALVGQTCGARPTAVIISACFSGVFIPALAASNRMILTAARADRSSFGCGESDRYPFFDGCVLESLALERDLIAMADRVRRCVAKREDEEGMRPRSEPQLYVGPAFRAALPPFKAGK
jgi:Peptidase C13 family